MARAAVAPVLRTAARSAPGPARSSVDGAGAWRSPHSGSAIKTKSTRRNHKTKSENNTQQTKAGKKRQTETRYPGRGRGAVSNLSKDKTVAQKTTRSTKNITLFSIFLYHSPLHHNPSQNQRTEFTQPQSLQKRQGSRVKIRQTRKEHRQRDTRIKQTNTRVTAERARAQNASCSAVPTLLVQTQTRPHSYSRKREQCTEDQHTQTQGLHVVFHEHVKAPTLRHDPALSVADHTHAAYSRAAGCFSSNP
jgi:hypothetical protein